MKKPLREHYTMPTDQGDTLAVFKYIEDLERYIESIDKGLHICDVNHRRELLEHFCGVMEFDVKHNTYEEDIEYFLHNYQSSNCG